MWDSILIFIAVHPFSACLFPIMSALMILIFTRNYLICRILASTLIIGSFILCFVLHVRWDSYSIHFQQVDFSSDSPKKILFIGDSITCEGTRPRGFITKLQSILPIVTEIICKNNATSIEVVSLLKRRKRILDPDLIIAQAGINNLMNGYSYQETLVAQEKLLVSIYNEFPNAKVLFVPLHPFLKNKQLISPVYSSEIESFKWAVTESFTQEYILEDGIHLNACGHTLLAKNLAKRITVSI